MNTSDSSSVEQQTETTQTTSEGTAETENAQTTPAETAVTAQATSEEAAEAKTTEETTESESRIETVSYEISYEDVAYEKTAYVYVPAAYDGSTPMNILYLMHGSSGSGQQMAETIGPLLDQWIAGGEIEPILIVFPTYYPDSSFVVANYSEDYPLNHFFATNEIHTLMDTVESQYQTFADRKHRAFGGYSMGGVTTWDVLAYDADEFAYFLPMAGDCWLNRVTDASSDSEIADLLVQGLEDGGYTSDDFQIIAMVGEADSTKYSMQPQIEALREEHSYLITDQNLLYWENENGGHSMESLIAELQHALPLLWTME